MSPFVPVIAALVVSTVAAYFRLGLRVWTIAVLAAIFGAGWLADASSSQSSRCR